MQMGAIPLLTRAQEIQSARHIESTRTRYRHSMLATDYVLQGVLELLEKVATNDLRLDRTIEVSVTNTTEKKNIMRRLGPNLVTLRHLLRENHRDYRTAVSKKYAMSARRQAPCCLVIRRNKAVRLIEEMNLRTNRLQPLFERVTEIAERMSILKDEIQVAQETGMVNGQTLDQLQAELHYLMRITHESPATLIRRSSNRRVSLSIRRRQASLVGRQLAAGRVDRQTLSQSRPELPGPDPGRQHRPDACRSINSNTLADSSSRPMPLGGFARRSLGPSPIRAARSACRST